MFYTAFRAILLALATMVSVVTAAPGLNLKVTGAEAVDGVENFKVVTTLTNTGDETLELLNDPRGALHPLHADTFMITTANGSSPRFIGVGTKYSLENAPKMTDISSVTVLAPGQCISVTHDLSSTYDFTGTGHGTYTVRGSNLFLYVAANNTVSSLRATSSPHTATLTSGKLAIARPPRPTRMVKRAQFTGCSSSQQAALNAAAPAAQNYTAGALAYLVHNTLNSSAARYTTWFGAPTDERYGIVVGHFASINSHDLTTFTYDCTCTKIGLASYVDPDDFGVVHLCPAFWGAPATGTDSQAGALVQQAAIFNFDGGCRDFVTGQDAAKALAQSDPDQAIFNADNHQYFAEDSQ